MADSPRRSYEAARTARRDGDEDWRRLMPIGWRVSRWWDINWPAVVALGVVLVALVILGSVMTHG